MTAEDFKARFLPFAERMYWTARRMADGRQEAEDIVQDVMLKLWLSRDQLPPMQNAEAYCLSMVVRRSLDLRCRRQPHAEVGAAEGMPSGDDLMREAELRSDAERLRQLVDQLPEGQRRVVWLRDVEQMDYDEIAERTGQSAVNVRKLLSRGRQAIRERFKRLSR